MTENWRYHQVQYQFQPQGAEDMLYPEQDKREQNGNFHFYILINDISIVE